MLADVADQMSCTDEGWCV